MAFPNNPNALPPPGPTSDPQGPVTPQVIPRVNGAIDFTERNGTSNPGPTGIVNSATGSNPVSAWPTAAPANPQVQPPAAPEGPGAPGAPPNVDYQPQLGAVDAPTQTVQGQLGDILKNGNPLLEAAKARAMQQANSRGLQNTSMAAQAGEEAVVNTALPIAQADAAAYQKQALVNQDISNQFLSTKMGAQLDLQKAYEAFKQNNYMFDKDEKLKRYINDTGISSNEKIAKLQAEANISAASIHAGATIGAAQIGAASNAASDAAATARNDANIAGRLKEAQISADSAAAQQIAGFTQQDKVNLMNLDANTFNAYANGINNISMQQLEPDAKQNAINNWNAIYAGNPHLTFKIGTSVFALKTTEPPPTAPITSGEVNYNGNQP